MSRVLEAVCIVIGFGVFFEGLCTNHWAPLLLGVALMNAAVWMPCVSAGLARVRRYVDDLLDDFGI